MKKQTINRTVGLVLFSLLVLVGAMILPYFASPIFDFEKGKAFEGNNFYNPYQATDSIWQQMTHSTDKLLLIAKGDTLPNISLTKYDYNDKDCHYFCLGADRNLCIPFLWNANINNTQFKINKLQATCDFLAIHPQKTTTLILSQLSNYDAISISSPKKEHIDLWDSVLSSGYYAVVYPNNANNRLFINSSNTEKSNIITALKQGKYICSFGKNTQNIDIQNFKYININNDTLQIAFNSPCTYIRLIGQNGQLKAQTAHNNTLTYPLSQTDTYIRIEVKDNQGNTLIYNPIVRCKKSFPINDCRYHINTYQTAGKQISYILVFLILSYLFLQPIIKRYWVKLKLPLYRNLFFIILISLVFRLVLAFTMELNFDELYYCFLSQFPALSYFDHPPMVTWLINLSTGFLLLDNAIYIRFSSILFSVINSLLIFDICKRIGNEQQGFIAVLLYNISPYAMLVTGTFILPDTGLIFFSLLAVQQMVAIFIQTNANQTYKKRFLLMGLFIGLACLSKYSAAFLWIGIGLYILLYDRKFLKNKYLYLSILITLITCLPILIWNINHDFISFVYQSGRVESKSLHLSNFFIEFLGELLYNNPVLFVLTMGLIIHFFKEKIFLPQNASKYKIFYCIALPFLALFWTFALFQSILPHWNAPAYILLMFPLSNWLYQKHRENFTWISKSLIGGTMLIIIVAIVFILCFYVPNSIVKQDFIVQLSTSQQEAKLFVDYAKEQEKMGNMPIDAPIISTRWMTAATYEHYISTLDGRRVLTIGTLDQTHEFAWKSQKRDRLTSNNDYWFITNDNQYFSPENLQPYFQHIEMSDTLYIGDRKNKIKEIYVYKLRHLKKNPNYFE